MKIKAILLATAMLVLATNVSAQVASVSYDRNFGWYGVSSVNVNPNNGQNGYVIGNGSNDNGTVSGISEFPKFNSALGSLTAVTLSYEYSNLGYLFGGAFSSNRVSGVTAETRHHGIVNTLFDRVYGSRIEDAVVVNSVADQEVTKYSGISIPWNTTQLWTGYYAVETSGILYSHNKVNRTINFDSSLFDSFTNQIFGLQVITTTEGAGITGCNYLSTCAINAWSQSSITNAVLTYTYEFFIDSDLDGIYDENDNCPVNANASQDDLDSDGLGNVCDSDDDNDGLSDTDEIVQYNTNPLNADSDGDGFNDGVEVNAGTDPNNAVNNPDNPFAIPVLPPVAYLLLSLFLLFMGRNYSKK